MTKLFIQVIIVFICVYSNAVAATIYMGPAEAYTDLKSAMAAMSSCDTLIIRDGTYIGNDNIINSDINQDPPDGSENNYTIIKAEHDGKVFFDGEYSRHPVVLKMCSYIQFEGLLWGRSSGDVVGLGSTPQPHHLKFFRCGFFDAQQFSPTSATGGCAVVVGTVNHVLLEECYAYGNYRYGFYAGKSGSEIIFRRCLARVDSCNTTTGISAFNVYDAQNVELQNCIGIDINNSANYYLANNVATIPRNYMVRDTTEGYETTGIYHRGCIALNSTVGMALMGTSGLIPSAVFINSVFWNTYYGTWCRVGGISFDHCTIGKIHGATSAEAISYSHGVFLEEGSDPVTNTIIYGISQKEAVQGNGTYSAGDYNYFYNNPAGNYKTWTPGANDQINIDPMAGSLQYLVRIEPASSYSQVASDGGDIGATIIYQYGKAGTLWGEDGYNKLQDGTNGQAVVELWPFPNEDLIKTNMAGYSYDDGSGGAPEITGARGFCTGTSRDGTSQTLTKYIWEYLGNQILDSVYGATYSHNVGAGSANRMQSGTSITIGE